MRTLLRTGLLVAATCAAWPVAAQVLFTPDESGLAEGYFVDVPALPPPVTIEENTVLRPGSPVPPSIPLSPFTGRAQLAKYGYFVSVDNKVVVVDPETHIVVRIFDAKR